VSRWLARAAAIIAVVLVGLAVYAIIEPVALFGYDGAALQRSLEDEAGNEYGKAKCKAQADGWLCYIETDPGSGFGAAYKLHSDDDGCWTARPVPYGKESPPDHRELSACVDLTDIIL